MTHFEHKWFQGAAGALILILILTGIALRSRSVSAQAYSPAAVTSVDDIAGTLPEPQAELKKPTGERKVEFLSTSLKSLDLAVAPIESDIQPDRVIEAMRTHYHALGVNTGCLPYRSSDVEIARVVGVFSHDHYKVTIPLRHKTLDVTLIGVSSHPQPGKASEAKRQAEALVRGKRVLLIRGASDKRGDVFVRYIVTADGQFLNYETMQYAWPLVSAEEEDGCYSILLTRANQSQDQ